MLLSPKPATVAEFGDKLSPKSATIVSNVDRALLVTPATSATAV